MGPAEKGHSPFPSSERAIYGFSIYLGAHVFLGESEYVLIIWSGAYILRVDYHMSGGGRMNQLQDQRDYQTKVTLQIYSTQ